MALIQCPDCKTELSSDAAVCPKCNRPMKKNKEKSWFYNIWGCIGLIILVGGCGFALFFYIGMSAINDSFTSLSKPPVPGSTDAQTLLEYKDKVLVRNVKVNQVYGIWSVSGELKNTGDRTLRRVEVTVYLLDKEGKTIGQQSNSPVWVTEIALGDNTPLLPNYTRSFGYNVNAPPSDWSHKVNVDITRIEYVP